MDVLADIGGQQVLSPYHDMACNPVSMMDPLGLQVFGPANPMTVQDPAAMARAIAPTLLNHMPGGGLWDMSNMTRYIANLPKDLQAEAWMLYLSGGATGASTFQSRLGDLLTERAANGNDRKGSWASDAFSSFVYNLENGYDVFDDKGNVIMTFLNEQQVYGFNLKKSIFERWSGWLGLQASGRKKDTDWADISKKVTDATSQASSTIEAVLHYIDKVTPDINSVKAAGSRFSRYLGYAGFTLTMYDAAKKGMKPHHYVDAIVGISAMQIKDPRVALGVGLGLFISDAFFIHNTGKSTTEYIFD